LALFSFFAKNSAPWDVFEKNYYFVFKAICMGVYMNHQGNRIKKKFLKNKRKELEKRI